MSGLIRELVSLKPLQVAVWGLVIAMFGFICISMLLLCTVIGDDILGLFGKVIEVI